jgi:hypothetical protein
MTQRRAFSSWLLGVGADELCLIVVISLLMTTIHPTLLRLNAETSSSEMRIKQHIEAGG